MLKYLFSLFFGMILFAQEKPESFTLDEAIAYAKKNNSQAINANRDIALAKLKKWETTAGTWTYCS